MRIDAPMFDAGTSADKSPALASMDGFLTDGREYRSSWDTRTWKSVSTAQETPAPGYEGTIRCRVDGRVQQVRDVLQMWSGSDCYVNEPLPSID